MPWKSWIFLSLSWCLFLLSYPIELCSHRLVFVTKWAFLSPIAFTPHCVRTWTETLCRVVLEWKSWIFGWNFLADFLSLVLPRKMARKNPPRKPNTKKSTTNFSGKSRVLVFSGSDPSACMVPTFCPLTIWVIFSGVLCRKPYILEADDFLGACYRKALTPKKLWTLLFLQISGKWCSLTHANSKDCDFICDVSGPSQPVVLDYLCNTSYLPPPMR